VLPAPTVFPALKDRKDLQAFEDQPDLQDLQVPKV
jgi:hypothetical protein